MDKKDLEERTKKFALEVIKFVANLPKNKIRMSWVISFSRQALQQEQITEKQTGLNPVKTSSTKSP